MLSPKDVVNREKALSSECPRWLGSTWNLPDSRFAPWVFFPCVLPVALASHQLVNPWFLPVLLTGIAAGLIGVWRSKGWPQRFLAMDLVATLVLGSAVVYATSLGEPVAFPTALLLAAILALGSVASLVFIERLPNAGVPGGTASENERSRLRWHRALAFVVLVLIVSLVSSARAFGPSPTSVAYTWLVSSSSFGLIWLLSAPCLLDGRFGRLAPTILSLIVLLLFTIWHLASTEVARHQAYPLLWNELLSRSRDDRAWWILAEGLASWSFLFAVTTVFVGFAFLSARFSRLRPRTCRFLLARTLAVVWIAGALFTEKRQVIEPKMAERYLVTSSAPWAAIHDRPSSRVGIDWPVAAELRKRTEAPIWEEGPAPLLASLAGRYQGRSIVLVLLESHGLNTIGGFGEGALHHQPVSPGLSKLMDQGISFKNYFAPGFATRTALWAVLTGLPAPWGSPAAVERAPEAAALGRMPDFRALGYDCQWMCPGSPYFDNWDQLMSAAGVRWWIENDEVQRTDRTYSTAWGMPDGALYSIALERYRGSVKDGRPSFTGILTVSNHTPYSFPDEIEGRRFEKNHYGGVAYADYELFELVQRLRAFPADERPIVFVTADTSYIQNLQDVDPVGQLALEGIRIPGLLLLPDGHLAGTSYDGVFCHEDVLDLLYLLVSPHPNPIEKFTRYHRRVAFANGFSALTPDGYYIDSLDRWFAIVDTWKLEETSSPPDRSRLELAWKQFVADNERLWPSEGSTPQSGEMPRDP